MKQSTDTTKGALPQFIKSEVHQILKVLLPALSCLESVTTEDSSFEFNLPKTDFLTLLELTKPQSALYFGFEPKSSNFNYQSDFLKLRLTILDLFIRSSGRELSSPTQELPQFANEQVIVRFCQSFLG